MSNHCIDVTCPVCGNEYDARLHYYRCPVCGFNREKLSLHRQRQLPSLQPNLEQLKSKKMNFGQAIEAVKNGKLAAREGWNGKDMFLYYVSEGRYPVKMDAAAGIADEDGLVEYGAYIALKTAQGDVVPWTASQTDILANDWIIVE